MDWKFFKNIFSTLWKSRKSTNLIKFCQNFQFLTFVIFVAEISNKHFCKLDKILRNFPSWQNFVFVTVFKKFGFEICNFKHWSCDILERYCTGWIICDVSLTFKRKISQVWQNLKKTGSQVYVKATQYDPKKSISQGINHFISKLGWGLTEKTSFYFSKNSLHSLIQIPPPYFPLFFFPVFFLWSTFSAARSIN